jgi:octaprenyl-diphosphate synthase
MSATTINPSDQVLAQDFTTVFARLKPQMTVLDVFLRDQLAAFEPEIRAMADYCIDTSGKRIRPALVFLSGWNGCDTPSPELVRVAAVVELVHLATLVHDDIMDEADLRRNRRTASREYGPEAAVLLGDALFAHALHLASQFPTPEICHAVSDSTRKVCAGEIVQTLRRGTTNISREDYFRVIDLKTAELFRISCFLGSKLGGFSPTFTEASSQFGRHLGIAYQIYDDLADFFGQEKRIGKTLGTDLQSGKVTLPLLALLERLPVDDRALLVDEILHRREPDMPVRLRQMSELGIFKVIATEVESELALAEKALMPHSDVAPVPLLRLLCDTLRNQVRNLQAAPDV